MSDYLDDTDRTARDARLLKLDEAAAELRCTRRTLERQIEAGRLSVIHIGRSVRVERTELEDYLVRLRTEEITEEATEHGQTA